MRRKKNLFKGVERWISILAGVVTILGLPFVAYQLWDVPTVESTRAIQTLMVFDQELDSRTNEEIREAMEEGYPILTENHGRITRDQLSDLLDIYESMNEAYEHHLIAFNMLYEDESYNIEKAYQNKEVQAYLVELRKIDPDYYTGFEALAKKFLEEDKRRS